MPASQQSNSRSKQLTARGAEPAHWQAGGEGGVGGAGGLGILTAGVPRNGRACGYARVKKQGRLAARRALANFLEGRSLEESTTHTRRHN